METIQNEKPKKSGVGVGVMILRDYKILLGKRNDDPEKASSLLQGQSTWTMPGGKLDFGEKLADAASRETLEETGLVVDAKKLKLVSVSDDIKDLVHFTTVGFLCEDFEGEPRVMEPEVIVEWRWFELDNLPSPIFLPSEKVLKNYHSKNIYNYV